MPSCACVRVCVCSCKRVRVCACVRARAHLERPPIARGERARLLADRPDGVDHVRRRQRLPCGAETQPATVATVVTAGKGKCVSGVLGTEC